MSSYYKRGEIYCYKPDSLLEGDELLQRLKEICGDRNLPDYVQVFSTIPMNFGTIQVIRSVSVFESGTIFEYELDSQCLRN